MDCYNLWHTCINVSYITALDWSLNLSLAGIFSGLTPRDEDDKGPVPSCGARVNDSCSRQVGLCLAFACVRFFNHAMYLPHKE